MVGTCTLICWSGSHMFETLKAICFFNWPRLPSQSSLKLVPGDVQGSKEGWHYSDLIVHWVVTGLWKYGASTINPIFLMAWKSSWLIFLSSISLNPNVLACLCNVMPQPMIAKLLAGSPKLDRSVGSDQTKWDQKIPAASQVGWGLSKAVVGK